MQLSTKSKIIFIIAIMAIAAAIVLLCSGGKDDKDVDIKGETVVKSTVESGVEMVFSAGDRFEEITNDDIDTAKEVLELRLKNEAISGYEFHKDYNQKKLTLRIPDSNSAVLNGNVYTLIQKLSMTSSTLVFVKGEEWSDDEADIVLKGPADIEKASVYFDQVEFRPVVRLNFTDSGKEKFATATSEMVGKTISIWLETETVSSDQAAMVISGNDNPVLSKEQILLSAPTVNDEITTGECMISGGDMTEEDVTSLVAQINGTVNSLPLKIESFRIIKPEIK